MTEDHTVQWLSIDGRLIRLEGTQENIDITLRSLDMETPIERIEELGSQYDVKVEIQVNL